VLFAFILVVMMAFLAFAIDLGYIMVAKTELQRTADSAAMAAAWELIDEGSLYGNPFMTEANATARNVAVTFASYNDVCKSAPVVDPNSSNSTEGDVLLGTLDNLTDKDAPIDCSDPTRYNVVRVRVQRTDIRNGQVSLFFARALGFDKVALEAEATAGLLRGIRGFQTPSDGSNLDLLPFALDLETWELLEARKTFDNWTWDSSSKTVRAGCDGIYEVNLYPQGTGSPGNRGTVDIGAENNSADRIAEQILYGITPNDLEYHGGELKFDEHGELDLNGDTGISAGVKEELEAIKGQRRMIPIFSAVESPGNNANYTIVKFVGVRILDVKLTGSTSSKRLIVQPANILTRGGIPSQPTEESSHFVYSYPILIR
jgi:hypothetical protein